jgi:hypothetical protein
MGRGVAIAIVTDFTDEVTCALGWSSGAQRPHVAYAS